MKLKVGIIDYGIGNFSSIKNTLSKIGFRATLSSKHSELKKSDLILLPGVGAFKPAMNAILEKGLNDLIYEMANKKMPIIGICLGMQLLGRSSIENEYTKGLNLITEDVYKLEDDSCHIGWNSAKLIKKDNVLDIADNQDFYFNHSYAFNSNLEYTVCETTYKSEKFSSIIRKDKVAGLQFHPEKSQSAGLNLLKKLILRLCTHA